MLRWRRIADARTHRTALLVILLGVLGGCGGKPMPFPIPESELGDRPGLFTGEKGSWEVFSHGQNSNPSLDTKPLKP
jgi:hypothetical protein